MPDLLPALADAVSAAEGGIPVERYETHGSWVFVAGERALKVKKPVVLAFLDYGTLERPRAMCREEVHVNSRLAPELYRGTVAVVAREDGGAATTAQLRAVGARLAAFHASEARPQEAQPAFAALRAAVRTTLDDLQDDSGQEIDAELVGALRGVMEAALAARRVELLERGRRGLVVDGHGDLRARSGLAHVSSDVVRKARAGLDPTDRAPAAAHEHEATLATYRELGEQAAAALAAGDGAVVDATLGEPAARLALRRGLGAAATQLRCVECRVPAAEAMRRARARERDAGRESDATAEVAARLAAAWVALDEVPADRHLVVRTDRPPRDVARDVGAWLDRGWA